MKVIILAGGLPSTLGDDSEKFPKPMAEIGGYPILWHIMKLYSYYGFRDFIICTGYKGGLIKEYFMDYYIYQSDITVDLLTNQVKIHKKKTEDWNVTILDTGIHTSITKRICYAREYLDGDDFFISYGDCVSDIDLSAVLEVHKDSGKIGTVVVARPTGRNTIIPLDDLGGFHQGDDGPYPNAWVNACTMVFNEKVFRYMTENDSYLEKGLFLRLRRQDGLSAYRHEGFWSPMETRRDHALLEQMWRAGQAPWKKW